jgi:hypothetical protein
MTRNWFAVGTLALAVRAATAQVPGQWVGAPAEEYARLLQLTGVMPLASGMIRPADVEMRWTAPDTAAWRAPWSRWYREADSASGRVQVFQPVTQATYNSGFPYGMNDGAMWAGRGLSMAVTGGGRVRYGPVTVDVAPTYTWSENKSFAPGSLYNAPATASPYADVLSSKQIDRPQRFGERAVSRLDPGQSGVSVSLGAAKLGWSGANMWWGPGIENSLIMSNNAAGFSRGYVSTRKPVSVGIGRLEALWTVGTLEQSSFWRTAADTFATDRWVNALTLVFEPKGAPGLYFGATRLFYVYERYNPMSAGEILTMFQTFRKKSLADSANPLANDTRDQMLSLSFRWVFPEVGFEAYGEWGRNDHSWDWRDIWLQPDLGRAYLLGARKAFKAGDGILAVRFETITLTNTLTYMTRGTPEWYAHHQIQQGWTQRGQVIGAGVGPGSEGQTLAVDWYRPSGRLGWAVRRHKDNHDGFLRAGLRDPYRNDGSFLLGPSATFFFGGAQLDARYEFQYELNRYSLLHNDARNHRLEMRGQFRWK